MNKDFFEIKEVQTENEETVLDKLSYGMYVVTTKDKDNYVGCVISVLGQITADPVHLTFCINKNSYTNKCIKENKRVAINILPESIPAGIIETFGYKSSKDVNKFDDVKYEIINDMPIINDCIAYIVADVVQEIEIETHTLFILKLDKMAMLKDSQPMTYDYYKKVIKGKSPKGAPTYQEK